MKMDVTNGLDSTYGISGDELTNDVNINILRAHARKEKIMCSIAIEIPNEVLYDTKQSRESAADTARKVLAMYYYVKEDVSIGYCAEIAGMSESEFIELLGKNEIDIFRFNNEAELDRDIANA